MLLRPIGIGVFEKQSSAFNQLFKLRDARFKLRQFRNFTVDALDRCSHIFKLTGQSGVGLVQRLAKIGLSHAPNDGARRIGTPSGSLCVCYQIPGGWMPRKDSNLD